MNVTIANSQVQEAISVFTKEASCVINDARVNQIRNVKSKSEAVTFDQVSDFLFIYFFFSNSLN